MTTNPVLDLPLNDIMRPEIALPLQQILHLHTVGSFLAAWRSPKNRKKIEPLFDSPEQAHHAAAVCSAWLGVRPGMSLDPSISWWPAPTHGNRAGEQSSQAGDGRRE